MADDPTFKSKIIVNGREVGVEDVPAMFRKFVEDADQNGIPDFMDQMFKNPVFKMVLGKVGPQLKSQLANVKNLTPEQRQKIELLMQKLGGITGAAGDQPTSVVMTSASVTGAGGFSSSSAVNRPHTPAGALHIDYKKMGIENPEQKSSFPLFLVAVLIGGLIVLAAVFLLRGHL